MKVEIWSDIMCPFCYIGKRNFEQALSRFPDKASVTLEWKSFQLDPSIPEVPEYQDDIYRFVATRKGFTYEQSKKLHLDLVQMAKNVGLEYNFDKALVANTLKAHKLIQLAKTKGLGDQMEERLFLAYFTQGKDVNDPAVLIELGKDIGLAENDITEAMTNTLYQTRVEEDIEEAQSLGVRGVPFFVIDRKYAIAGAQQPDAMLMTLEQAFTEWKKENPTPLTAEPGASCFPDGQCK
jgi:predicted DsbA family dithiol-disulfide isomerase